MARRLQALDEGIAGLKQSLGEAWKKTVVVAASEFGRTVHVNGTGGTDHGTAGIVFVLGGAVAGGTIHAEWSGLESRQRSGTAATFRHRPIPGRFSRLLLADHLGVPKSVLDEKIFPDSGSDKPSAGLIRA